MPEVREYTGVGGEGRLRDKLPEIVAEQMSCYIPSITDPAKLEYYRLDPEKEIDLLVILCDSSPLDGPEGDIVQLRSKSDVIIEIAAYDFENRMRHIDERIKNIATRVKEMLELGDQHKVSITFIPVRQRCWVVV